MFGKYGARYDEGVAFLKLKSILLSNSSDTRVETELGRGEKDFKFLPRSYSSAVEGDVPSYQTAATKSNSFSSDRKFNLVGFGIEESPKGTQRQM